MISQNNLHIPNLIKSYPHIVINNLSEKDIIYFCRVKLYSDKDIKKPLFEKEILDIIQSKNWDWFAQDIDQNIILTYSIRHNAFLIVQYLLENNIYNLKEYNENISNALCSFGLTYKKMLNYILLFNPHPFYLTDICSKAYNISIYVADQNKQTYFDMALSVMNKDTNFKKIADDFITNTDVFSQQQTSFLHFLNNSLLPINDKTSILDILLDKKEYTKTQIEHYQLDEKIEFIKKWKLFHDLDNNMPTHQKTLLKIKI